MSSTNSESEKGLSLVEAMTPEQKEILSAWLEDQREKSYMPVPEHFPGDSTFQIRHIKRGERCHTIVEPPRRPEFWFVEPLPKGLPEGIKDDLPVDWLRVESVLDMLFNMGMYPYVLIDGVRVGECWRSKAEPVVREVTEALWELQDLLNKGHEDDRAYQKEIEHMVLRASDYVLDYGDVMADIAFREGIRLGQKLRPEDFSDWGSYTGAYGDAPGWPESVEDPTLRRAQLKIKYEKEQ